jgi:hypothetical protein
MPPAVSFTDQQLALVGSTARAVPISARFIYLRQVAALLPEIHTDDDVRRACAIAADQIDVAIRARALGDRVVFGASPPTKEWTEMWSRRFDYSESDRSIQQRKGESTA